MQSGCHKGFEPDFLNLARNDGFPVDSIHVSAVAGVICPYLYEKGLLVFCSVSGV
jgi:hypothetical protein